MIKISCYPIINIKFIIIISIIFGGSIKSCIKDERNHQYFISNSGNDHNNGKSPEKAWKSLNKVNKMKFSPGDEILFEANGVWRGTLDLQPGNPGSNRRITYSRYGNGENPKILGSEKPSFWIHHKNNIWRSNSTLNNPTKGGWGYPGNTFFIKKDSIIWGKRKGFDIKFKNLTKPMDWTWNNKHIYIYSENNPNEEYNSIEISQRDFCVFASRGYSSYINFNGIDLHFSKLAGFYTDFPEISKETDLSITNATISYIGIKGGSAAYGVEVHHSNLLIENCTITDCGRRGISFNMYRNMPFNKKVYIKNVVVKNNIFKRGQHTTSLDMAMEKLCTGDTIQGVYFFNNIIDDHEITMEDDDKTSNQLYFQPTEGYLNNVYIFNNIFINATARNILVTRCDSIFIWHNTIVGHNPNIKSHPYGNISISKEAKIDFRNNILYQNLPKNRLDNFGLLNDYNSTSYIIRDYNLYYQENLDPAHRGFTGGYFGYFDTNSWKSFLEHNYPWESNSPTPQNPRFKNYIHNDFSLTKSSVAINSGTPINLVKKDIYGRERNKSNPSIGAIEYIDID